jgi:hypothetical protein
MNKCLFQKVFRPIFLLAPIFLAGCGTLDYGVGRDTVEAFGNGRYQIQRGGGNDRYLCDSKKSGGDCESVESWISNSQFAYVIVLESSGSKPKILKKTLVLIDLQTEQKSRYESLSKVPLAHQPTFSKLMK